MIVLLDSGVIHTLCNCTSIQEVVDCQEWFYRLTARGMYFTASEIGDYEVRRELKRRNRIGNIQKLEALREEVDFLPLTHQVMLKASELWAIARQNNQPTSSKKNIDVDMILSAQWSLLKEEHPGQYIVIATTNTKHLRLFTEAEEWININF